MVKVDKTASALKTIIIVIINFKSNQKLKKKKAQIKTEIHKTKKEIHKPK